MSKYKEYNLAASPAGECADFIRDLQSGRKKHDPVEFSGVVRGRSPTHKPERCNLDHRSVKCGKPIYRVGSGPN